ncbi:MAG: 1-acyl-sn-glycerol-3-phosphate acyltransferase [Ruminobacter sp.]|uniref:1-acyl-sn-glycerol-3-phosphate acyltransferase n=1 Tax=Ruminobacter sp. TaxID=2774296 RepID=UPI001B5C3B19|nr:1-acyl-sn-glycerol-3-phosphate acyltransferase [Ruminobacter sp.]MBP3748304.1 1-acyl-sn-glycerol-3-phosphate acyltransferase [Ruminobacter sp.]
MSTDSSAQNNESQKVLSPTEAAEVITTESSEFDDIRHYRDDEVHDAIQSILDNDELVTGIYKRIFGFLPDFLSKLGKPFIKFVLKMRFSRVRTIAQVQEYVAKFMKGIIRDTTDGFTCSGFEKLDPKKGYLFISNHRDISLDPAFIDMACYFNNLDTVKIAIGDNLLRMKVATDLMRLNKSFIVKRSVQGRDKLKALAHLSEYIGRSIEENHNVWIAQREGRAKDGNDKTEEAILKMFYMYGKKKKLSFAEYVKTLNIVPVSITYEFDPGDAAKAKELYETEKNGSYVKSQFEDIDSIVGGINGYKGRVNIVAGDPLTGDFETPEKLAEAIDNFIYANYAMFPSCLLSAGVTEGVSEEERKKFEERISGIDPQLRDHVKKMYAAPYFNQQNAKKS